ncbi:MAG: diphthine--ammonia ligase [Sphingobacteriaceae bacterium]|nr:diphthine--ammonia ligase [Sphingobacteriaceae bacterium]
MPKIPAVFHWSGGKDSTLALHYILKESKFDVRYLLTTVNNSFDRVSIHGVRKELLIKQANSLRLPLYKVNLPETTDMEGYEKVMEKNLMLLKNEGLSHSIFGDIFLEDLKTYRENQLVKIGMEAIFPLWKQDSLALVKEFIELGYQTIVVCAQDGLEAFCGRIIDQSFLDDLPENIDPCGENGEFHTFVFDGPIFNEPIKFLLGEKIFKTFPSPSNSEETIKYCYIDLLPV